MKRFICILVLLSILAAAFLMPEEAGENYSRDPYLIVIDADGNVIEERYRQ